MANGKLIALEGLDGAGKTTQCHLLVDYLTLNDIPVTTYPLYRHDIVEVMLERLDETEFISNIASRYAVISKVLCRQEWEIKNKLSKGEYVILDKFLLTFFATEMVRGCSIEELMTTTMDVVSPDITFCFDIDPEFALKRKKKIGYRESGLDMTKFKGERVEYSLYKKNAYPNEWLQEQYVDFQTKLRQILMKLMSHNKHKWGSVTKLDCRVAPFLIHETIKNNLLL
ncbi:thymidylate kinase [Bacillus sp. A301a_S52]|nr:thymidylate kinase [Bacillus sp. A301a_S52]